MTPSSLDLQAATMVMPWRLRASTASITIGCNFGFRLPLETMLAMAWESV